MLWTGKSLSCSRLGPSNAASVFLFRTDYIYPRRPRDKTIFNQSRSIVFIDKAKCYSVKSDGYRVPETRLLEVPGRNGLFNGKLNKAYLPFFTNFFLRRAPLSNNHQIWQKNEEIHWATCLLKPIFRLIPGIITDN